jgi:hypothetical protein
MTEPEERKQPSEHDLKMIMEIRWILEDLAGGASNPRDSGYYTRMLAWFDRRIGAMEAKA